MKRLLCTLALTLLAAASLPAGAQAAFGIHSFDFVFTNQDGTMATQAGSHPFAMTASFGANLDEENIPEGWLRDLVVDAPTGFVADLTAYPRCTTVEYLAGGKPVPACPLSTQIGITAVSVIEPGHWATFPVFNLNPPPGAVLRLAFRVASENVFIDGRLSPEPPYHAVAGSRNTAQLANVFGGKIQLWGDPSSPDHDELRGSCGEQSAILPPGEIKAFEFQPTGKSCPVPANPKPLITLPGNCAEPLTSSYNALSWNDRDEDGKADTDAGSILTHDPFGNPEAFGGCGKLGFTPKTETKAGTQLAETGTGLDFTVSFADEGLTSVNGLAQSYTKKAVVTLPEGLTINPSVGEGLAICTPAQIDSETLGSEPGEGCPDASKLGTLQVETPLLDKAVNGSVFLAQQDDPSTTTRGTENPFDSLIALYLVLRDTDLGIMVKLPLKVEPDPRTGQLVATLDDSPQLPVSRFNFHFKEGARAPLVSPPACGTYTTVTKFYPWSDPSSPRTVSSSFEINAGVGGGPCPPGGVAPFAPTYQAGSLNNNAASHTPFHMRLIRRDGEQNMTKFSSVLPPGVLGSLVGVSKCPEAAIEAARHKRGRAEIASPSCPASSLIGHSLAGAGVGDALTYVGGQIYLAGPFRGTPLSVVSITPAVAGPFDADTVVVRLGLTLNPKTAEVEVDGSASEPIPHILKGIVLKVRDLRVYVDRPDFIVNPTSCDPSSARATLYGSFLDLFTPADDVPVDLQARFQAANCQNLGFKPKLDFSLKGGTKRGGHPVFEATYRPRPGDANVKGLVVRLPRSAFLDQAHIRTICTRVQFAADACPKGAQYGYIKAFTPLLDEPLQGPVWLRSSDHKLPDLVFDLRGIVNVEVVSRIDSARGGIRATLEGLPDAPLSKVVLRMQGAEKGLIVNSTDLCSRKSRADIGFSAQNGKRRTVHPLMRAQCGAKRAR